MPDAPDWGQLGRLVDSGKLGLPVLAKLVQ